VKKYSTHRTVRLEQAIVMPGLVNVRSHLELPLLLDHIRSQNYGDWVLNLLVTIFFIPVSPLFPEYPF
jgi:cytosine/adenosine deaminase-related metal-dependent hydrolase